MEILVILLVVGAICGFIGFFLGDLGEKKNGMAGFVLGFVLGPLGWIIVMLMPRAADNDAPVQAPQQQSETARKIAQMEAQIAQMKRTQTPPAKPKAKRRDDDNDGQIPTYKLD